MYQSTKDKPFYTSLKMMRSLYVIPKESENTEYLMKFRIMYSITRAASSVMFVGMPGLHMVLTIRGHTGVNIIEDISTMVGGFGALLIGICFVVLREGWMQIFLDLEHINLYEKKIDFENLVKKLNLLSSLYGLYISAAISIYAAVSYSETSYCKNINREKGLHEMCGFFTPIVLPFDGNNLLFRVPIFGLQLVLAYFTFATSAMMCFLNYEVVESVSFHLQLIKQYYLNAFQVATRKEMRDRLRFCVNYHITILSLCERFGILAKYTIGSLCITCALIFASIGNLVLKTKPVGGLCYLTGYMAAFFLLCHGGQRLIDEACTVEHAVYDSKWYEMDAETMRDVCFILARSQKPIVMHGWPLGVMDYPMFLMIMKTSYTYLTLLNQKT